MPQPRQALTSTTAWGCSPPSPTSDTALCGQTVSQTPQPMQTSSSDEATWAGVSTKPVESIEMTRAAAALAWAIVSGMLFGPCAVPATKMPERCVSTGLSLGWYSLMKPAAALLQAGDAGDLGRAVAGLEAGREHDQVEQLLDLAAGERVLEAHAQALVGLLDDLADAAAHVAHAALLHEPVVLLVRLAGRAQVGVADRHLGVGVVLLDERAVQRREQAADGRAVLVAASRCSRASRRTAA